ncbi:MAG: biotin/lipoyl-binding protein [Treponema sp.]|nr:biotin/lipoyl-binding protein [Treponema sp.]MBP5752726.1 biotin/lipoyl-binding protein [Treponema sp.]
MPKNLKRFLIFVIILGIIITGLVIARRARSKSKVQNVTYTVNQETYENVIEISGVVSAAKSQNLQALSSGTVVGVYVKQGDHVKKGDVILQLDDTTEKYNLARHEYDMETTRITGSARQYELMQTQRNALVQKISERKITAQFDGIIADINVAVGDALETKNTVGTLVDVSYLTADVEIPETDVSKLKVGQKVEFTFSAIGQKVYGSVVSWPAIGSVTNRGATVVKAKVRIDEYPEEILPNFSFSGKIEISPTETFLVVSRYAVGRDEGQAYVEKVDTGEKINVVVTPYGREYVKVESGLSGGEVLKQLTTPQASGFQRGGTGGNSGGGNRAGGNSGGFGGGPGR